MQMNLLPDTLGELRNLPFHAFAVRGIEHTLEKHEYVLTVNVSYPPYNDNEDKFITLRFNTVIYHSVMPEEFVYMFDGDDWVMEAFLAKAKSSQLIEQVKKYTLLGVRIELDLLPATELCHYRITGQDLFIDVISTHELIIVDKSQYSCWIR
jgi:hypothetical protein